MCGEWWSGGAVEWWSGGVVERCSGGAAERWCGGEVDRWSGGAAERWSGGAAGLTWLQSKAYGEGGIRRVGRLRALDLDRAHPAARREVHGARLP